jgi:CheY-like chemotaxis protein
MSRPGGRLLLILASREPHTTQQLINASGMSLAETLTQLRQLVDQGFIVAPDEAGVAVYRLNPKGVRTQPPPPQQRILLIEDDLAVQDLMVTVLEDDGYALVIAETTADGVSLLNEVAFDLVLTDGFAPAESAVLTTTEQVRLASRLTPVALFSAHRLELDQVRAAGFRDLIEKPFELDRLEHQIRALLDQSKELDPA